MPASPDLRRLRREFERFAPLPRTRRRREAERAFAGDPDFLRELLLLLDGPDAADVFLEPPPTRAAEPPTPEPTAVPGEVLAGRWRLVRTIGRGGQGVVWAARDLVAGGEAAVKLLRPSAGIAERIGRESAALRWLRLPGVVRMLDDGREGEVVWIAMERLDGERFPGRARRGRWRLIEPVAVGLLETLARVHGAGVVHGDLKPSNVLVDDRGVATVLDLGLAAAAADRAGNRHGGTPGYAAPEQECGTALDVRSDLYSFGVLLFEALRGFRPRGYGDALPRRGVPPRVRRVIARLLAPDPAARPATAAETLRLLRPRRATRRRRRWTESELQGRFRGPDRLHHLREDAARELFRRTRGQPRLVEEELASWMRAGLARTEDGLVVVDRVALERLPTVPSAGGVVRRARGPLARADAELAAALRTAGAGPILCAALRVGRLALDRGRGVHALSALEVGVGAARTGRASAAQGRALVLAARAALSTATSIEIERALWLVGRAPDDDTTRALRDVLRAAAANHAGDPDTARRLATRVSREGPRDVRPVAWSVRALASQALDIDVQRRAVAEGARWAARDGRPASRRAARTWRAWLLYRQGRCADAARLHRLNFRAAASQEEASRSLVDAATAARDAGHDADALKLARVARLGAARARLPVREARAWLVERAAGARVGKCPRPDLEVIAAVDSLGFSALTWNSRMTESVFAWKRGETALAREILAPLPLDRDASHLALYQLAVACFAAAVGGACDRGRRMTLARRAVQQAAPTLAVQCLALLAEQARADRAALRRMARRLRLPARGAEFTRRREFLSVADSLAILGRR